MSSLTDSEQERVGRSKHLARLAFIFYRRGASWKDFARFIDALFSEDGLPWKRGWPGHTMKCRHNPGGIHHEVLQRTPAGEIGDSMFNPEHYKRPCLGWGKGDDNKSPGIVVHDLCNQARAWLRRNGKGVIVRGRMTRSRSQSSASSDTDSWPRDLEKQQQILRDVLPDFSSDELAELIADSAMAEQLAGLSPHQSAAAVTDEMSEEFETMFSDAELLEIEAALLLSAQADTSAEMATHEDNGTQTVLAIARDGDSDVPMSNLEFATSSDPGTQVESGRQSSTKMRVATLAMLKQWTDDPRGMFRDMFSLLRNSDDSVLHLCGCGIKFTNSNGENCSGCVEPSHLMLGTPDLNRTHLIFHKAMQACDVDDYLAQVGIAHRARAGCEEIF